MNKFSNLMMDAEREIAKANPPEQLGGQARQRQSRCCPQGNTYFVKASPPAQGKRTDLEPVKPGFTGYKVQYS